MNVVSNINKELNKPEFFPRLIALVLSTLLIGFAPSSIALGVLSFFSLWYTIVSKRKIKLQFELLIPISIYVLFVLTLFWTINIDLTIKGLERTISLCVVPIIFLILPKFNLDRTKLVLEYFTKANL
ncbi:MAG: hypothetical protein DRI75_09980, partial [Bacteroidetes bacterium]